MSCCRRPAQPQTALGWRCLVVSQPRACPAYGGGQGTHFPQARQLAVGSGVPVSAPLQALPLKNKPAQVPPQPLCCCGPSPGLGPPPSPHLTQQEGTAGLRSCHHQQLAGWGGVFLGTPRPALPSSPFPAGAGLWAAPGLPGLSGSALPGLGKLTGPSPPRDTPSTARSAFPGQGVLSVGTAA